MLLLGLLFGFFCISQIEGTRFVIEDVYFDKVSDEYFDVAGTEAEAIGEDNGVTAVAMNITIIKQIPAEALAHLNLYGKSRGEFETSPDLTANAPWCVLWKDPIILKSLGTALGISESNCPPPIGDYQTTFWQPPIEEQAITLTDGEHKLRYTLTLGKETLLSLICYVELYGGGT